MYYTTGESDGESPSSESNTSDDEETVVDENDDNNENELLSTNALDVVNVGKIIALFAKYFISAKCRSWGKDDIFDSSNHMIKKGKKYLKCNYLKKPKQIRGKVCYRMLHDFDLPGYAMSPIVKLDENLELAMDEYQWLLDTS